MKKKIILLVILLSCAACNASSTGEAVEPEKIAVEPSPKPTIIPTATILACDDQIAINNGWFTIYCDNFEDNRNLWESVGSDDLAESAYQIEDGKLVLDFSGSVNQAFLSGVVHWRYITEAQDYTISVKGQIISDYKNAAWGINFREGTDGFYSFLMTINGVYWLDEYKNDRWEPLITQRSHNAIVWEEENELVIIVEGDQFQFFVNEELINTVQDDSLTGHVISLAVWTAEGVTARFEFDDLVVKEK